MKTYETDAGESTGATYIWTKNDAGNRVIHACFYGMENKHHQRDAELACDALNLHAEKNRDFDINATINEQNN